jgi:RNA polymerase sigma-70 factor (ECF subfamily)
MAAQPNAELAAQTQPRPADTTGPSPASVLAAEIKALVAAGDRDAARERFGALVAVLQRRAVRIAFQYLRDAADADEAVQDAFVKVFLHIEQYRSELPFDVWFTRILVNAALDRLKARGRQQRWISHSTDEENGRPVEQVPAPDPSHERRLLAKERCGRPS